MLSYLNMMSGGALARCTLFALGVTPYINASIIVQLLTVATVSYTHLDVYKRQVSFLTCIPLM